MLLLAAFAAAATDPRETVFEEQPRGIQSAPMQKNIYSLPALRKLLAASNRRYLEFLSAIKDPRAGRDRLDNFSQPVELLRSITPVRRCWRPLSTFEIRR